VTDVAVRTRRWFWTELDRDVRENGTMTDDGARPRLLLVEDDPRIASFLVKGFRAKGFDTEWVETGMEALAQASSRSFDVVVLDLGLPDIDGLDVLAAWREEGLTLPVVVLTARSDPRDRARALDLGISSYLMKPAPFTDLLTALQSAMGTWPTRRIQR
jgi:DNA-binding response OmpR family regulator